MPMAVPPPTTDSGDLSTSPSTFFVGDTITITANFADSQSGKVITFFKETSPGSGQYDSIGTKTASSSGNGSLTGYTINEQQKVFAQTSAGKATEVDTLTPKTVSVVDGVINACFDRDDGELSVFFSPATMCTSSEKPLTWNAKGIQGDKGDKGDKGDPGANGTDGKDGAQGPPGPASGGQAFFAADGTDKSFLLETVIASKSLPAGKYAFIATVVVQNRGDDGTRTGSCSAGGQEVNFSIQQDDDLQVFEEHEFTIIGTSDAGVGEILKLTCKANGGETLWADQGRILASKVDSIG